MRLVIPCLLATLPALVLSTSCQKAAGNPGLRLVYGAKGLERLSFGGVVLEDLAQYPADAFHIWHIKATGLHGKQLTDKQYGWGEVNNGKTWDPAMHTWLYSFVWGTIRVQFAQTGNTLGIHVEEKNNADSAIILNGATIYPLVLHFPELPEGFGDPAYEHLAVKLADPAPTAKFGDGQVAITIDAADPKPLYRGFEPAGNGNNFFPVISTTAMDSMSAAYPRLDRPVAPGQTDSFNVELRFAAEPSTGQ